MNPFSHNYFLGYINEVGPQNVRIHFPTSSLLERFFHEGVHYTGGNVGNFIIIEGEEYGFLARMIELNLPDSEKKEISEKAIKQDESSFHPSGKAELLLSFSVFNPEKTEKTVSKYPSLGAKVYACSDEQIGIYVKEFGKKSNEDDNVYATLGKLTSNDAECEVSLNALFGRHCAVVGTTGGGKSWTVAKLIESIIGSTNNKVILIDATGEYENLKSDNCIFGDNAFFHYSSLSTNDVLVLLRPGGQVQAPKLVEAIKSLKILRKLEESIGTDPLVEKTENGYSISINATTKEEIIVRDGTIVKMNQLIRPYNRFYSKYITDIDSPEANFNINKLDIQLINECVWDTDPTRWGNRQDNQLNHCVSLILRAKSLINNPDFANIFGFGKNKSDSNEVTNKIESFLKGKNQLLRLAFNNVTSDFQIREILVNAIGQFLLEKSLKGDFKASPLVVFMDEAHRYLNKNVKDEYFESKSLDAYDLIAKECRKFGLFLCLATQMPRDIPIGTLSQMGTFIVHRLINEQDKKAIENAASSANRSALSFLPILGEGEALLVGVDFPMPLMIKIHEPNKKPESRTPRLKKK
ncbi:MAG: ATP-binding protein [Paludibacter sp.]